MYPKYTLPPLICFYRKRCKYVSRPIMQSCVELQTSGLWHYMQEIAKCVWVNPLVREHINNFNCMQHKWLTYLSGRVKNFVDSIYCERVSHLHLSVGAGSSLLTPKVIKWNYINNTCLKCGVEKLQDVSRCEILSKCIAEINVLRWISTEQQVVNKKIDKKYTQLELGVSNLPVGEVVKKLITKLNIVREHQAKYEWRNQMLRVDLIISNDDFHCIIFIDFDATLDLMAVEKDNSSVNNHAVIFIFFVCSNWSKVRFKR